MRNLALAVLAALAAQPLLAAEKGSAVAVTPDGALHISAVPCAAYVPGVDAEGHAVAPADLPSAPSPVTADNISIEIDARLAGQFGIPQTGGSYRAKGTVGYVTVENGKAYFNGKPLGDDASAAIAAACAGQRK